MISPRSRRPSARLAKTSAVALMLALLASPHAYATPECQNLGPGDPMTSGDDTCTITGASPIANAVDALGGTDTLHFDTSGGSFAFAAGAVGGLYTNFENALVDGGN